VNTVLVKNERMNAAHDCRFQVFRVVGEWEVVVKEGEREIEREKESAIGRV
jgi:hypothetical protein